jgi:hypothetical protein
MAKMSGGRGMPGMPGIPLFGGPPPALPKKKKSTTTPAQPRRSEDAEEPLSPTSRAPPVPMMMALPGLSRPAPAQEPQDAESDRDEEEDANLRTPHQETAPSRRSASPPRRSVVDKVVVPSRERGAPPPVPGGRPAPPPVPADCECLSYPMPKYPMHTITAPSLRRSCYAALYLALLWLTPPARPPPPPPPASAIKSPSEGSVSDDELSERPYEESDTPRGEPLPTTRLLCRPLHQHQHYRATGPAGYHHRSLGPLQHHPLLRLGHLRRPRVQPRRNRHGTMRATKKSPSMRETTIRISPLRSPTRMPSNLTSVSLALRTQCPRGLP